MRLISLRSCLMFLLVFSASRIAAYPIDPFFTYSPVPTVIIDGVEWSQVDVARNLDWSEIDAICPAAYGGICGSSPINGFDMSGWTWASIDDVNALFNVFLSAAGIASADLLSGPDVWASSNPSDFVEAFYSAGFRYTDTITIGPQQFRETFGWTSDRFGLIGGQGRIALVYDSFVPGYLDSMQTNISGTITRLGTGGGWFYRSPAIPEPQTWLLMLAALAALSLQRRRRPAAC